MSDALQRPPERDPNLFRTITGDDWKRSIARSKSEPNLISEQIAAAVKALPVVQANSVSPDGPEV